MKLAVPEDFQQEFKFPPTDWVMYHLRTGPTDSFMWQKFKVMCPSAKRQPGQARAFTITWSPEQQRVASGREALRLQLQQPDLYKQIVLLLELTFDRDWLTAWYDSEEIEAERARLTAVRAQAQARRAAARV